VEVQVIHLDIQLVLLLLINSIFVGGAGGEGGFGGFGGLISCFFFQLIDSNT
jgi:hypothetical protein